MKKNIALVLISLLLLSCSGSKKTTANPAKVSDSFKEISTERLRANLTVIASDEMEGRETGSEGQKKAGRYIIDFYKKLGIGYPKGANNYYQHMPAEFINKKYGEKLGDS